MNYQEFVSKKVVQAQYQGFDIDPKDLHPSLYPHQRDIVTWNVKGGCRAVFASFGLGKTRIAIETVRQIINKEGGKGLFIAPLGVRQEFTRKDGPAMGVDILYCKTMAEVEACQSPYIITNYERVRSGDIDPNGFTVVSLDEASTLRSKGSETFEVFMTVFKQIKYRFVYTATPSPNRYLELINYAHFLGVMDRGQALTRFFIGTVPVRSIVKGRLGKATELNTDYWKDGVFYLKQQESKMNIPTLFDVLEMA